MRYVNSFANTTKTRKTSALLPRVRSTTANELRLVMLRDSRMSNSGRCVITSESTASNSASEGDVAYEVEVASELEFDNGTLTTMSHVPKQVTIVERT